MQSIDDIIGNPFINQNKNMFTAPKKQFTDEETKIIINAMD